MKITWYTTLSGVYQWKDYKNGMSDPLSDIRNNITGIRERFGKNPNFIKTSYNVVKIFIEHPDIVSFIAMYEFPESYSIISLFNTILKRLFGIREIKIDYNMENRMLIAYKENDEIYPDEKAVYEIRGIL